MMRRFFSGRGQRLTIVNVNLYAYDGPHTAEDRVVPPFGVIAQVRAETSRGAFTGLGEARIGPKNRDAAWTFLTDTANRITGTHVRLRRKTRKSLAALLDGPALPSDYSPAMAKGVKALRSACDNVLRAASGEESQTYEFLQDQRPEEEWPTVVTTDDRGAPLIDLMNLYPEVSRFASFPSTEGPYKGELNEYSEFLLPGAPIGVPSPYQLERAALSFGLSTTRFRPRHFIAHVSDETPPLGFKSLNSSDVSAAAQEASGNKATTKLLLERANIPHPPGQDFQRHEVPKAEKVAEDLGYPVVVKPIDGKKGYGITTDVANAEGVRAAAQRAIAAGFNSGGFMVEKQAKGSDYRVLATEEKVLSIIGRTRAHVVGNGVHSIAELLNWACAIRRQNPNLSRRRFQPDVIRELLDEQGYRPETVPDKGTVVVLARTENMSQGGNSLSVLPETHPSICRAAVGAIRAMGLPFAGVDMFLEDHTRPISEQDANILELNTSPGMSAHHHPMFGESIDPYVEIVSLTARNAGVEISPPPEKLSVAMSVEGKLRTGRYLRWIKRAADELDLSGSARIISDESVEITAYGGDQAVASFLRLAMEGSKSSRPDFVHTEPNAPIPEPGFLLLDDD